MPKMRASFQGLVRLLAKSLYPEPDVFVRELLQNAHDSIQLRQIASPIRRAKFASMRTNPPANYGSAITAPAWTDGTSRNF